MPSPKGDEASEPPSSETFQGLLLRCRGRSGLTQPELAERVGVHIRSIQDWESGSSYPSAERLRSLIAALLDAGGLAAGHEGEDIQVLWSAALRSAPRMRAPLDSVWLADLLNAHGRAHLLVRVAGPRVDTTGARRRMSQVSTAAGKN